MILWIVLLSCSRMSCIVTFPSCSSISLFFAAGPSLACFALRHDLVGAWLVCRWLSASPLSADYVRALGELLNHRSKLGIFFSHVLVFFAEHIYPLLFLAVILLFLVSRARFWVLRLAPCGTHRVCPALLFSGW